MRVEVWGETVGGTRKKENGQKWLTGAGEGECETMGGKEEEKDGGTMLTYVVVHVYTVGAAGLAQEHRRSNRPRQQKGGENGVTDEICSFAAVRARQQSRMSRLIRHLRPPRHAEPSATNRCETPYARTSSDHVHVVLLTSCGSF